MPKGHVRTIRPLLVLTSQDGSAENDVVRAIVAGSNETVILAGYTEGNWAGTNVGGSDFAAFRARASFFSETVTLPDDEVLSPLEAAMLVVGLLTSFVLMVIGGVWAYRQERKHAQGLGGVPRQLPHPVAHGRLVTQATEEGDMAAAPVAIPLTQESLERERAAVAGGGGVPLADVVDAVVEAAPISSLGGSGRVWNVVTDAEVVL